METPGRVSTLPQRNNALQTQYRSQNMIKSSLKNIEENFQSKQGLTEVSYKGLPTQDCQSESIYPIWFIKVLIPSSIRTVGSNGVGVLSYGPVSNSKMYVKEQNENVDESEKNKFQNYLYKFVKNPKFLARRLLSLGVIPPLLS